MKCFDFYCFSFVSFSIHSFSDVVSVNYLNQSGVLQVDSVLFVLNIFRFDIQKTNQILFKF